MNEWQINWLTKGIKSIIEWNGWLKRPEINEMDWVDDSCGTVNSGV